MSFASLELSAQIMHALEVEGYAIPTPIQAQAIPLIKEGRDLLGVAQTGTGKTAAFALPIIHRLTHDEHRGELVSHPPMRGNKTPASARKTRALILAPTRELASQIAQSFKTYGQKTTLRQAVIFGGVGMHGQVQSLQHGVDVIIATPGRLIDLMEQGYADLRHVQTLVLDEADNMLDMGFIAPIRRIVSHLPKSSARQTLMFSATMPKEIRKLADEILENPETVEVTPVASTVEAIEQRVYFVEKGSKAALLAEYIKHNGITRALVFTRTKHGADRVARHLHQRGIDAMALHGNKTQGQRQRVMKRFKAEMPPILVATDIAARGLDIDEISHVINYDLPNVPETYVHRIGRTGRAGAAGTAISFCDRDERVYLRDIERLTGKKVEAAEDLGQFTEKAAGQQREERPHRAEQPHREQQPRREHAPRQEQRPRREENQPRREHEQQARRPHHSENRPQREGHRQERPAHGHARPAQPQMKPAQPHAKPAHSHVKPAQPHARPASPKPAHALQHGPATASHPRSGGGHRGGSSRRGGKKTVPWKGPRRHRQAR